MKTQRDLARYWLVNLFLVVVGYLSLIVWLALSWYFISLTLYSPGLTLFQAPSGPPKPPEQSGFDFPLVVSWSFIVLNLVAGLASGYLLVRWSSPRQSLHANMLAIAIFATFLQAALDPHGVFPKWIIAVLMSAEAIAIVAGAHLAMRAAARSA